MIRSFRYRLRPTRKQEAALVAWLAATRELYNAALQERRDAWAKQRVSVGYVAQSAQLAAIRADRPDLATVPLAVLRGALRRLDRAFVAFFRHYKTGAGSGFPRFKGRSRWSSLLLDDLGRHDRFVSGGRRVALPFVGKVRCYHEDRPVRGMPKTICILRDARGRWLLTVVCDDVPAKPLPQSEATVGVDLGLRHFAATSDGETFANPRVLDAQRLSTERAQRRVSRRKKGSRRRRDAARLLRLCHERTKNLRREHHIAVARSLVARYGAIYVENLNVVGLARGMLSRPVHDAAWSGFRHWLSCKAEEAGRTVVEVDPRGTSQTCSGCGAVEKKSLSERVHRCDCGLTLDRDVNAAINIKGLGLALRRDAAAVGARQRPAKPSRRATGTLRSHRQKSGEARWERR